jgi:hypothetical protein
LPDRVTATLAQGTLPIEFHGKSINYEVEFEVQITSKCEVRGAAALREQNYKKPQV